MLLVFNANNRSFEKIGQIQKIVLTFFVVLVAIDNRYRAL